MQFPERYQHWQSHDLAQFRPPMYAALAAADEPVFWRWMEDRYLSRYREFLSLQGDIDSAGAWGLWFPGSVSRRYFVTSRGMELLTLTGTNFTNAAWRWRNGSSWSWETRCTWSIYRFRKSASLTGRRWKCRHLT